MNIRRFRAIVYLGLVFVLSCPARAQQKPLTKEQVVNLVRNQLGDETGAKAIETRGIDFAPSEDFLQSLKDAGAHPAFIKVLRAAKPVNAASEPAKKPLSQVQILALMAGGVSNRRITTLIGERGIDFAPQDDYLGDVRQGGGDEELLQALKTAKVIKPVTVDTTVQTTQAEVRKHLSQGAQFSRDHQLPQAEQEYRAAVQLDPNNPDLLVSLSSVLGRERKYDDCIAAARSALRLNPENDHAHNNLGVALLDKGDVEGAISELREALRINPKNDRAHHNLGRALARKGDAEGAMTEYREALRLNPNYESAHYDLAMALVIKRDMDAAIAEYREALRINPKNDMAHDNLGVALRSKGDEDGAIAEWRAATRANPKNYYAHDNLGLALERKGDKDGAVEEFREALRLNSNFALAHYNLAQLLYKQQDRQGALGEFRAAYMIEPQNTRFKAAYEKLLGEQK